MKHIKAIWDRIGEYDHHGINLPLSGLHSKHSCGIGEYLDLIPIIDWLSELGMDCLQLLPLNDSGPDPSPYNAQTANALHPLYLSLHALPGTLPPLPKLPLTQHVDYTAVLREKLLFLRTYVEQNPLDVSAFTEKHAFLKPYALFKVLKDIHGGQHWEKWPQKNLSHHALHALYREHAKEMHFHLQVQYHCHAQLSSVKQHAEEKGVFLKGDIPILVSPDSAEVWNRPGYFDCTLAAGAPPDENFNPAGQYWGFPLYNWKAMAEDDFAWWKERLAFAAELYHLFRIDHVVGFFRIWAIEKGAKAKTGHFEPKEEIAMHAQGRELMQMIVEASNMLPIAEDLGTVPPYVRETLKQLKICGTRVFRWERDWEGDKHFIPYEDYPPLTLSSVSTHDTEIVPEWWRECASAPLYAKWMNWTYRPTLTRDQHLKILYDNHHSGSLFHINLLQEYLVLFPELTHASFEEERINEPGFVLPTNWTYRYRPSVEELIAHPGLRALIHSLLT